MAAYSLVHIVTGGEYKKPLVASQSFDQAETQAVVKDGFGPGKVEVWCIEPMRDYFDKEAAKIIDSLSIRCPHVTIRMINGIDRLNRFPTMMLMKQARRRLGRRMPVIYHCRGEHAARWAMCLAKAFPGDKVVLDVRGYWPAELLYNRGIDDPAAAKGKDLEDFRIAYESLKNAVQHADAVTTVSDALKELLIKEMNAPANTSVVPCCVSSITGDERRTEIRQKWGVKEEEIVLVYSGTTAAYQHLADLTIPFMKHIRELNGKIRLVFISPEKEKITALLHAAQMNMEGVIVDSLPQKEVAAALTACDAGMLIRKPSLVNRVANPVKVAEYLAAGLPIIIEKGVGGVSDELFGQALLKDVAIALNGDIAGAAAGADAWLRQDIKSKRPLIREYAKRVYLWSSAVHVSRRMYEEVLGK